MRILTIVLALCAIAHGNLALSTTVNAQQPSGWQCLYEESIYGGWGRNSLAPRNYACYGRTLRQTKARARQACNRLTNCVAGPCYPLEYRPRHYCSREP